VRTRVIALLFVVAQPCAFAVSVGGTGAGTAEAVIARLIRQSGPHDEQVDVTMALLNADGSPRDDERAFRVQGHDSGDGSNSKALVSFLAPRGIQGTRILTLKSAGESGQWIYLPAAKKVSRVETEDDVGSVLDSDLSYADLKGESQEEYQYAFSAGELARRAPAVCREPAYAISAVPRRSGSHYSKRALSISIGKNVICDVLLYDRAGKLVKSIVNSGFARVGNVWRPAKTVITTYKSPSEALSRTVLTYTNWKTGLRLPAELFSVNRLSQ
jgi:hypothetical protein